MLVAIQYISCSQCSAQASLSEYSELQYSSAATNHLHTISEWPLLTLPSLYYHSVHDPLLYYPVIKSDITTRRKYEPAVKFCHFSPSSAFVGSESPTSYQQEQFSTIRRLWSTMLKLVLFSATSISCNSRRLRGAQRGGRLRLSLKKSLLCSNSDGWYSVWQQQELEEWMILFRECVYHCTTVD